MPQNARAYYSAPITQFSLSSTASILGDLAAHSDFDIELAQRDAWSEQILILKTALSGLEGTIFLEFVVPRIGSRIDAVLISGPVLFVIEFKVGASAFARGDINQVWDYALDLKNFHRATPRRLFQSWSRRVLDVRTSCSANLTATVCILLSHVMETASHI